MIYYDAPWDNRVKEPVPVTSKDDVKEDNKEVNTELILAGAAFVGIAAVCIFAPEVLPIVVKKIAEAAITLAPLALGF